MKIAIVCPNDFSIVTFCKILVSLLQNNGANAVYAICDVHDANPRGYFSDIMKSWGVHHLPIRYYRFLSVGKDASYILSLYKILKKEQFDIVINIATKANVYGSIVARLVGTRKIICSVWGLGVTFGDNGGARSNVLRRIVVLLYWMAFKLSSKVWFTNEHDYKAFVDRGIVNPNKAFLTRNYVNTDDYSPNSVTKEQIISLRKELNLGEKDRIVVMVARMSWAKGVKEFVDAAAILRDQLPMIKFVLVGPRDDGSTDSVPEAYLIENKTYSNFIWTGFRKDVQVFYAASDLAVLPSYYREGGYPRGLTEAMSMGKPIVTTDSVHCRATVEHGKNGYHVPVKDSRALAHAIKQIMTDDDMRERFGRYSRMKTLNEFDERKVVSNVVQEMLI